MKTPTIQGILGIDATWTVTRSPTCIELSAPAKALLVIIPLPYDPKPLEWWMQQARVAVQQAQHGRTIIL